MARCERHVGAPLDLLAGIVYPQMEGIVLRGCLSSDFLASRGRSPNFRWAAMGTIGKSIADPSGRALHEALQGTHVLQNILMNRLHPMYNKILHV